MKLLSSLFQRIVRKRKELRTSTKLNSPNANNAFKYDVAFSFLTEDEGLALKINDLIRDRLRTFIYSKRQDEIVGMDGEKKFKQVFSSDARIVAILYREGWGKTSWTRMEEEGIRKRAYNEGYEFTLFITLEESPKLPSYLPPTDIYYNLKRFGIKGAASAIEAHVKRAGGAPKEETAVEIGRRLERQVMSEEARRRFLHSNKGVGSADREVKALFDAIIEKAKVISSEKKVMKILTQLKPEKLVISAFGFSITLNWECPYYNSLDDSYLRIILWKGRIQLRRTTVSEDEVPLRKREFHFDMTREDKFGWRESSKEKELFITPRLADECLKMLFSQIEQKISE